MSDRLLNLKCQVAKSQLRTALDLFIADGDPISVQCLACGGWEIIEAVADRNGKRTFSNALLEVHGDALNRKKIVSLRNQFWNAFKHLTTKDGGTLRDEDEHLLSDFDDRQNDAVLFGGWYDYMTVTQRLPIEAQVFQIWWFACNERDEQKWTDTETINDAFPGIRALRRPEQKVQLRKTIATYKKIPEVMNDPRTES